MNTTSRTIHSWGRVSQVTAQVDTPAWIDEIRHAPGPVLARGLGRSAGDCSLPAGDRLIETRFLDRMLDFDPETGLLRAEAGISLDTILRFCVPKGWFLPTTPGTRQVTLGGAIANDVHGKNQHRVGCFGNHVPRFELLRSDGSRTVLSAGNPRHAATIGGLGLTGIITWAELQLVPIRSAMLDVELVRFRSLDEFLELSRESDPYWEHSSAWIDGTASRPGRGIFLRGNWSAHGGLPTHRSGAPLRPFTLPTAALHRVAVGTLNQLHFHGMVARANSLQKHYASFFHPIDPLSGDQPIHSYQVVIPAEAGTAPLEEMLRLVSRSEQVPLRTGLKSFGSPASPGLLSFPRPGISLALDLADRGADTLALLRSLDDIVRRCDGRFYPAKDTRMTRADFERCFPGFGEFRSHIDPGIRSKLSERLHSSSSS